MGLMLRSFVKSMIPVVVLLAPLTVSGLGHWCETVEQRYEDHLLSPRLQLQVSCSQVYQYNLQGWRLDVERMRAAHGGDDGIARYYQQHGNKATCFLYKPSEMERQMVNRTVRACCEGWSGPHCKQAVSARGQCFSTWSCEDLPGMSNTSLVQLEQCCGQRWALSWRNASDHTCLSCTYTLLPDSQVSPVVRGGLLSSLRAPQNSATCMSWGGSHYRTFDRKHFHFQGGCTYLLASSTDGTWAVYVGSTCEGLHLCSKTLKMMLGLDLVTIHQKNLTLNGVNVAQGQPVFQNGVSVHWVGDFVFVESGLGVRVKFDLSNTLYLTVSSEHQGTTRGLCGLYNNNADDDFTTMSGSVSRYAASFGNSWRVPDQQNEECSDAAELGHSCAVSGDAALQREAESVCHRLLEEPFIHCHSRVDPAAYMDTCLYLFCSLSPADREAAVCDTVASYTRECAQQHVLLSWRTDTFCARVCPRGQVFSDCVSSCPPTCASPLSPGAAPALGQCREECVGGCECPPGLHLHQGQCLQRDQCPCFHRRRTYQPGDRIQQRCNTCECQAGQWQCTSEKCSAQCSLMGALQVTTFDKKRYSVQGGDCAFIAVEDFVDRKLVVSVRTEDCRGGGGRGCLTELSVTALHTTVTVTHSGAVTVNGRRQLLPVHTGDLVVQRASSSFVLVQTFGAQLLWHLEGPLALITLQPGFAHKVRGLCGTLTWTQDDDFTTPEGDVESSVSSFVEKFSTGHCRGLTGGAPDPCTTYTQRRDYAEALCSVIHSQSFQKCHDVVDREPYFRLCLSEVCDCGSAESCHCPVLTAYTQHCAQEGAQVHWRNHTFCPVQCSGGQVYQECGRACGSSCSDLPKAWSCDADSGGLTTRLCVPGCQCPPGLLQDPQGQCVPPDMCPCVQGDQTYPPGTRIRNNCNTCVCEQGVLNCSQEVCEEVTQCPGALVYSPRSCLMTCSSLDHLSHSSGQQQGVQAQCREPLSGCVCPQGTVLLGDRCVLPDECPCHHNGRLYYTNDTIRKDCNKCVCRARRWHCSQAACAGVCVATGDPHYVTFDGRSYSFLGDCQYVLVRERSGLFSVTAENVPCGSTGVTCTKSVSLSLGNTVIHMLRGKAVTVNGMPVTLPKSYSGSGLSLEQIGLYVSLSSRQGVTLLWDGGMRVYVRLAAHLRGRVGGLCGNFDGDTENDFTTRQGIVESTPELFGNSWKVSPSCPDVADQDLKNPCKLNPHRLTWARKRCSVLTQDLFSRCHLEVPFQQYYDWCVFDTCGCDSGGDCECLCTALAAYAEECNRRGVYIRWRSQEMCPLQCENGLVYEPCGPACTPSCPTVPHRQLSQCSDLSCVEGCFCPAGTVRHGEGCVVPAQCPCEWDGSMFPPGSVISQHCQNCSCEDGLWSCAGVPCPPPLSSCEPGEFSCSGGRCIPSDWLCDNEDDCGDGSDEICPSTYEEFCGPATPLPLCPPGEFQCANGKCLQSSRVCDGRLDCGFADSSDEHDCGAVCDEGEFLCAGGRCILYIHRCDGHDDCGDFSDERGCVCSPGEFQCPGDQCVPADRVCDGHKDCPMGTDEAVCPRKVTCGPEQFACSDGSCIDSTRLCDGRADCPSAEDERRAHCHTLTPPSPPPTAPTTGSTVIPPCPGSFSCDNRTCVNMTQVCNGFPDCPRGEDELVCDKTVTAEPSVHNRTSHCPEFTCSDGSCVPFNVVCNGVSDCSDSPAADEQGCRQWGPWGPWSSCSVTCGTGSMSRQRSCSPGDPLYQCRGPSVQRQQCFNITCPVDGQWLPWVTWSNCSSGCGGVQVRHRGCTPPLYGGRPCSQLPGSASTAMEILPCPGDGSCANSSCPAGLVKHSCAPCPLSCAHVSSGTSCDRSAPCFSGCWCPEGLVMSHTQQCVRPEECVCEVAGVRYWPGQQIKQDCDLCVCERGRAQKCQPNPDCSLHCGWSSWSEWGECLGPCGVQSVQWSFRSPNNPILQGDGRACRGIYRKARRCQTEPCQECEYQGQVHTVGDRWRAESCQLCQCMPSLRVHCAPFCQYAAAGCPQGQTLVPGEGDRCCYCQGDNETALFTVSPNVTPKPAPIPLVPTYPLPPGDECWSPLGVQSLPASSFSASSQQAGHPPEAARLHSWDAHTDLQGWSPEPEDYRDLPQRSPDAHSSSVQSPFIQINLLQPHNITGVLTQGGGVYGTYVSSFYLQFSHDGTAWNTYKELVTDARPKVKVFIGNRDDRGVAETRLDRMVSAQYVRLLPHDFQHGIYLRLELMGCADGHRWITTPQPHPVSPTRCSQGQFQCQNGLCVEAGPQGVLCDGVNDCGDGSDEWLCGTQPSTTPHSPRSCPVGQFSCPPGICIDAGKRCDGVSHCPGGEDEIGCHPHDITTLSDRPHTPTPAPLRTPSKAPVTHPAVTPTQGPKYQGICSSPLGLEDGRIHYRQLTSSTHRENNPADAGRLNIVPNVKVMEPGWSPLPTDPQPYFQVDFLEPTWVSGVVTQGSEHMWGYLTKYRLAFSLQGNHFTDYTETGKAGSPPKVFEVRMVGRSPVTRWLGRLLRARYLRIIPVEFRHTFYLRAEILGCTGDELVTPVSWTSTPSSGGGVTVQRCSRGEFACRYSEDCVSVSVLCDGKPDCKDHSDEISCGTVPTRGSPGLQNHTSPTGRPSEQGDNRTGSPGLHSTRDMEDSRAITPPLPAQAGGQQQGSLVYISVPLLLLENQGCTAPEVNVLYTSPWMSSTPDAGLPRVLCVEGQFACLTFGCVDSAQVCDGRQDCLDGSDERHCGTTARPTVTPRGPSPCSSKQFWCGSGECVHLERRCDLQQDCVDGSDEKDCVDCIMSPWTTWSQCSVSCGLGSLFRQRDILREALPGGACGGAQFDSRACFPRACPVDGQWSAWTQWSECDVDCGGGLTYRNRSCSPPKNGGQDCEGMSQQSQSCNNQPCTKDVGTQTGCMNGMVLVTEADCQRRKVKPCPPTCSHLGHKNNCTGECVPGCRCPQGLYLSDGRCVTSAQCGCVWGNHSLHEGQVVRRDQCTTCLCRDGRVTCNSSSCVQSCHWSAWSSWTPCDVTCGLGLQQRFRSPVVPAGVVHVPSCPGDSTQARRCFSSCVSGVPDGEWSKWTAWSECSKTCFSHVDDVGVRRRFRSCNHTSSSLNLTQSSCEGDTEEQEPCNTFRCPVNGAGQRGLSGLSVPQTVTPESKPERGSVTLHQLSTEERAVGRPHIQTRDCNAHPCLGTTLTHPDQRLIPVRYHTHTSRPETHPCLGTTLTHPDQRPPFIPHHTQTRDTSLFRYHTHTPRPETHPCLGTTLTHPNQRLIPVPHSHIQTRDSSLFRYHTHTSRPETHPCLGTTLTHPDQRLIPVPHSHIQTRDLSLFRYHTHTSRPETYPCLGVCPKGMMFLTTAQCEAQGGACPRLCLDMTPAEVECATTCYDGCYCAHGFYLYNGSCVPLARCPCYHQGSSSRLEPHCPMTPVTTVDCGWSSWTQWSSCSRTCDVGVRRRYRSGTNPPPAFGGRPCQGERVGIDTCSIEPCFGVKEPWGAWSRCTVTCGGGYRSRTRGPIRTHGTAQQFSACNLQPCGDERVCPPEQQWKQCVIGPVSCSDLLMDLSRNCTPGCQCPPGFVQQDAAECVLTSECRCDVNGNQYYPGNTVPMDSIFANKMNTCQYVSCEQHYDKAEREGLKGTFHYGSSSESRYFLCLAPCSEVPGTVFSSCGPSCPRSCDDLAHCDWRCEPGCYCTEGKVLSANGTSCVEREECPCLHLTTGRRLEPGENVTAPDGCNNCTCEGGRLSCTRDLCPVSGGWCEWSDWTPCSRTCGAESVSRYRSCACPEPKHRGASCPGEQEVHNGVGVQIQRQPCPVISFCPVQQPPARFGGLPCVGESRQTRGCHDNTTVCSDCGGGQVDWPCGKPCPRSCSDLHGDTECLDSPGCTLTCGCPGDTVLQDGVCVSRDECRCKFHNSSATGSLDSSNASWVWPGGFDWHFANPGESVITDCKNCSCEAGVLLCESVPGCHVDGGWSQWSPWTECSLSCGGGVKSRTRLCNNPAPQSGGRGCLGVTEQRRECNSHACSDSSGPWLQWSQWSLCTVSCGGGQQSRFRLCRSPPCSGPRRQSKTCNTQVCLEVGCPPGRLYRECERGEGCPFSCSQISGRESCYSDGCEEGCHCPINTYQHQGDCLQECPCLVDKVFLSSLQTVSVSPLSSLLLYNISEGMELQSGDSLVHDCSTCECMHGQWNCSLEHCPVDGGLSSWGPWSSCSLSCGGLGMKTRFRSCTQPAPAHGGRECQGARQESTYCQAPDCPVTVGPTEEPLLPDEDLGFSSWSSWSSCSKSCTEVNNPATKTRHRECIKPPCSGTAQQEKACNLPQCPVELLFTLLWSGPAAEDQDFFRPGSNGSWCEDILGGNLDHRFCNIKPCRVDGGWSRWSPWSRCDQRCGGGRSIRTRSCSSPPPKNGGKKCEGEKNQVKPCNTKPCEEKGCPLGQEFVLCANQCPQRCSDLQQGIECQGSSDCQPGCRCPTGTLEQDGACVQLWQCDCVDALGHVWAAGSSHQAECNNCSCSDGQLLCTNHSCQTATCAWSSWSNWAPCSTSCGRGQRTRYRSLIPETEGADCQFEEVQHKPCDPGLCPPLCLYDNKEHRVGDTWLLGECQQCTCTPEGPYCQDIDCRVDGGWTPWSEWSDCSVSCGRGSQVRSRACINPPPRNNGSHCRGEERESQECHRTPCLDDLCPWSSWSPCSQTCGAGSVSRRRMCVCEENPESICPEQIQALRNTQETQLCYKRPCPGCPMSPWTQWSSCSCMSQRQQRHRVALAPATGGQQCSPVETQSRLCSLHNCTDDCPPPFVFSECGAPCDKQCALLGQSELCLGLRECTPGCYCPPGLLHRDGSCVPPQLCGCVYPQSLQDPGQSPTLAVVPQGGAVTLGCSSCFCDNGTLECDMRECEVILSEWSEWTPCSPCVPLSSLSSLSHSPVPADTGSRLVSLQKRFRACLDPDSGLPLRPEDVEQSQCEGEVLQEERFCPDLSICTDQCQWSAWSSWTVCADPCSGGVRQRYRWPLASPPGPRCKSQQTQSQSCNTGLCPGERCEDRGRSYQESCANQCPRSCTDLWEHVQCLQGVCHPGCRCGFGQLLQDGHCVPVTECRCGVPSGNGTLEFNPGQSFAVDCNTCVCDNGTLVCTELPCPLYQPWSPWSSCSATCGRGQRSRSRMCQESEGGPPCEETSQTENCALEPCPAGCVLSDWSSWSLCSASCGGGVSVRNKTVLQELEPGGALCPGPLEQHKVCNTHRCRTACPKGQVFSECAGACPHTCEDLWTHTQCLDGPCSPGCSCPEGQVLLRGLCVLHMSCPCSALSLPPAHQSTWTNNTSSSIQELADTVLPPGTRTQHLCNTCVCEGGRFNCSSDVCDVDCEWSGWSVWTPCSVSCGTGHQTSSRHILKPRQYRGAPCEGPKERTRTCTAPDCACPVGEQWKRSNSQDEPLCEKSCLDMYSPAPARCSHRSEDHPSEDQHSEDQYSEGCVCQDGLYRHNSTGQCVIPALCPCLHQDILRQPGSEWEEGCRSCRCVNGRTLCQLRCPPLHCEEGEVKVEEPGSCCPVCRKHFPGEPGPECRRYTQLRNITKGLCRLDNVEVSFCRGRCVSKTDVILEEPYLQSVCECCSYRLDPDTPVRFLSLQCPSGDSEPVVLPVIHSCECTSCQGGDLSRR
ncbi:hypothetical protein WMY93_030267 [Mugilogobius chulae]|uniref:SCO-spondin n=1 Tax=Mugilogobius chulae TaxID=88201 RepID=A0AAW0MU06_9GOBI